MGDQDDGAASLVEAVEDLQNVLAGLGVQGAGGLIGHDDGRMGGDGPGDGDSLLLASGHLGGPVAEAVGHAHPLQGGHDPLLPLEHADPLIDEGELHILIGGEGGDQVIALENEADLLVADVGQLPVGPVGDVGAVEDVVPVGGNIQTAQNVHQGGLARAGGPDDGHELPTVDGQSHAVQGPDLALLALVVDFINIFDLYEHGSSSPQPQACSTM